MIRTILQIVLIAGFTMMICVYQVFAIDTQILKARVSDIDGRPMEGARLLLYDSTNVRRPADFISSFSDRAGRMQIALPPGKYWAVARFKSDGKYGPLLLGDKHSGEPLEVDLTGSGLDVEFFVSDIRELGQKKRSAATESLSLKGRVIDTQGAPVAGVFVFANTSKEFNELPDFISAWTGEDGKYELFLPLSGKYFAGASRQFPLKPQAGFLKPFEIESGKIDIATDIDLTVQ